MQRHLLTGFHLGVGGNPTGIGDNYYKRLAARNIPFVVMSADNFPAEAQELAGQTPAIRHFVGYRRSTAKPNAGGPATPPSGDPNVPRFGIPAQQASDEHWAWHTAAHILPSEFDGRTTYLLTINEPNKDNDAYVEWLAEVEYHNCQKALAANIRYAVFGWAGGNPEPRHWQGPNMIRLLNLIKQQPGKLAVALHEYSWTTDSIWNGRQGEGETAVHSLVGRGHDLLLRHHPTLPLVITEFGWADRNAPTNIAQVIREIREVNTLYLPYENFMGMATWYLGPNFGDIHNIVNTYIRPVGEETINNPVEVTPVNPEPNPEPPEPPDGTGPVLGADVSHWQGSINFQKMADAGARYVFIKASQGISFVDPKFSENWQCARRAHWVDARGHVWPLLRGAYHFYENGRSPTAQAAHFMSTVPAGDRGELPPAVDLEEKSELQGAVLRQFTSNVGQQWADVIVYTGGWWTRQYLKGDVSWLTENELWHTPIGEPVPYPWDCILIEQSPSTPRGIEFGCESAGIDLDYFDGSEADVRAFATMPTAGRGKPRVQYRRVYWLAPADITLGDYLKLAERAWEQKRTLGFSHDDAGIGALEKKTAVLFNTRPEARNELRAWFKKHYPGTNLAFTTVAAGEAPPETDYTSHVLGEPRVQYSRTYWCVPPEMTRSLFLKLAQKAWEQKRTLGFSYDDAGLGNLDRRDAVLFNVPATDRENYVAWYNYQYPGTTVTFSTIEDGVTPPPPPPPPDFTYTGPPVTYAPAIHAPGSDWMWQLPQLRELISYLAMPVKFLSNGISANYFGMGDNGRFHMVRIFWQPDRAKSPQEAWADVRDGMISFYNRGARNFELLNEPNLPQEGYGLVWHSGADFGRWLSQFAHIIKQNLPQAKLYYPGLSPGVPWTNQVPFTDAALPLIRPYLSGMCVHAYTGNNSSVQTAVTDVVSQVAGLQRRYASTLPLVVSECSVNRPATYEHKARVYREIDRTLATMPGVQACCYFISHWDAPPEQASHMESWMGTSLPRIYKTGN